MLPTQEHISQQASGKVQNPLLEQLGGLSPTSFAAYVQTDQPLTKVVTENEQEVLRQVDATVHYPTTSGTEPRETTIICIDPGKFSNKAGGIQQRELFSQRDSTFVREAPPRFVTINEPVAFRTAVQASYASDSGPDMYRLRSTSAATSLMKARTSGDTQERTSWYTFGHEAIAGDALPVSEAFHQRWKQWRYRAVWYATITKAAQSIGLQPTLLEENSNVDELPAHQLILCITLPDIELIDANGKQELDDETKLALNDSKGEFVIEQADSMGKKWVWKFQIIRIDLVAQTLAVWFALFNDIEGKETAILVKNALSGKNEAITGNVIIDEWGGGDRQRGKFQVRNGGRPTMYAEKLDEGTHALAAPLIPAVFRKYHVHINLAQAQLALHSGSVEFDGTELNVQELVDDLSTTGFEKLITTATITNEVRTRYWIHAGGGAALLHELIRSYLIQNGFHPHQFMIVPVRVSPLLAVIGGWARTYFLVKETLRQWSLEQQQQQDIGRRLTIRINRALNHLATTDKQYQHKVSGLQALKQRVTQVPEWAGNMSELKSIEDEFVTLIPQEPWNDEV